MNKLILIGNLVKDPEQRTTDNGIQCSTFTLAVNRRTSSESTDYFRVTAWRQLGALCAKYLSKGRKVCVTGPVSCNVSGARRQDLCQHGSQRGGCGIFEQPTG